MTSTKLLPDSHITTLMFPLPFWKISALVLIFPPEHFYLVDFIALLTCRNMLKLSSFSWLSEGTVYFQKKLHPNYMTSSFQWDLLDELAASGLFKLSSCWHCHSYSTCLLYKGVSFLNHLNMVCGYTTLNHTLQGNVHTRAHTLKVTRGPYQQWQQIFSSGSKSNRIERLTNTSIFKIFSNAAIFIFLQKATNTVAAGCGETDPIKPQYALRNLTKPYSNSASWLRGPVCLCVRDCLVSN